MIEQLDKAIAAHAGWKGKLRIAIDTGKSEFDPAKVAMDNQCEFGKWFYSLTAEDTKDLHYEEVKKHHADFHRAAAKVLDLALAGKKEEAEKEMGLNSEFSSCSSKCTIALMNWKKDVK